MDGTVRVWNLQDGTCQHTLTGHTSLVGLLGLSPSYLVSAAADSTLRIWDPDSGELKSTLAAHTGAITCFQHDEFKVLSGSDGNLKMWNIRDGTVVRDLLTGITGVWQVVFEGRWCVAASNREQATVLDVWDFGTELDDDWVGEPPSWQYDDDIWDEEEEEEEEEEVAEEVQRVRRSGTGKARSKARQREDDSDAMDEDQEIEEAEDDAVDAELVVSDDELEAVVMGSVGDDDKEEMDLLTSPRGSSTHGRSASPTAAEGISASRWAPAAAGPSRQGGSRLAGRGHGSTSAPAAAPPVAVPTTVPRRTILGHQVMPGAPGPMLGSSSGQARLQMPPSVDETPTRPKVRHRRR